MKIGLQFCGYLMALLGVGLIMTSIEARHIEKKPNYHGDVASTERLYAYGIGGMVLTCAGLYAAGRGERGEE